MKLKQVFESLTSAYVFWGPHLLNRNFIELQNLEGNVLCWQGYNPGHLPFRVTEAHLAKLVNEKQFSCQMEDGSIFRFYYVFDRRGREIQSASLAFYAAITSTFEQEEKGVLPYQNGEGGKSVEENLKEGEKEIINELNESAYVLDATPGEKALFLSNYQEKNSELETILNEYNIATSDFASERHVSYLRIDYAPHQSGGVLHHDCHLHISGFPYTRMIVSGLPTPKQFVEFIMAICYPDIYRGKRLNPTGMYANDNDIYSVNSPCFHAPPNTVYNQIAHLKIPTNTTS